MRWHTKTLIVEIFAFSSWVVLLLIYNILLRTEGGNQMRNIDWVEVAGVASAVVGVFGFISVLVTQVLFYKKDSEKMSAIHTDVNHGKEKLDERVENECKDLSQEHKDISKNIQLVKEVIRDDIYTVKEKVGEISAFQQKEEAIRQEAAKYMPKEENLVKLVQEVFENNKKLMKENNHLQQIIKEKEHIIEQEKQIIKEKDRLIKRERKISREKEIETEIEIENDLDLDDDFER